MPSEEQIAFFKRWNEAAQRADRGIDLAKSMEERLNEAARLSAFASQLRDGMVKDDVVRPD